jgi:hypothetical protein
MHRAIDLRSVVAGRYLGGVDTRAVLPRFEIQQQTDQLVVVEMLGMDPDAVA